MARPRKKGVDYFPFDVGFLNDSGVRILKSRYHSDGIFLYIHILCDVYREGYYLTVKNYEDYLCVLADDVGIGFDKAEQILTFICNRSLLVCIRERNASKGLQEDAVFTSRGIQKRYVAIMKNRKKSVAEIKGKYWLLTDEEEAEMETFYKSDINESYSEKNPDYSEKNPDKSEINSTNKIKGNKRKEKEIKENNKERMYERTNYQSIMRAHGVDDDTEKALWYYIRAFKAHEKKDILNEELETYIRNMENICALFPDMIKDTIRNQEFYLSYRLQDKNSEVDYEVD